MTFFRRLAAKGISVLSTPSPAQALFPPHMLVHGDRAVNEAWIRSMCDVAYLGDDTALCRTLGRYKMVIDTNDHGIAPHLMLDGYWEMWVTEVIAAEIKPGMIVADIGANLGYFTLLMAELVGPTGLVHAFEPNPAMVRLLQRSVEINGFRSRACLHQTALGDVEGATVPFVVPENEPKNGHLQPAMDPATSGCDTVQTRRLDSEPAWTQIQFAKIDVEGAEEMIWAGARGLLDCGTLRTVVLEFTPGRYADPVGFLAKIGRSGFRFNRIDFKRGVIPATTGQLVEGDPAEDRMLLLRR